MAIAIDDNLIKDVRKALFDCIKVDDYDEADIERYKCNDLHVRRYIVAKDGESRAQVIDKTAKLIKDVMEFRQRWDVANTTIDDFSPDKRKYFDKILTIYGKDLKGAPIMWSKAANFDKKHSDDDLKKYIAWITFKLDDDTLSKTGFVLAIDYEGMSASQLDMDLFSFNLNMCRFLIKNHHATYCIELGLLGKMIWPMITKTLSEDLRHIMRPIDAKDIDKYIAKSEIPPVIGRT